MKEGIISHVKSCDVCQLNKHENKPSLELLDPIPIPNGAWQIVTMDFIVELSKSENKDVILVVIDKFIKYGHFIPLAHPISTLEVSQAFLEIVYKLITDRDPIFASIF
jgi:hypothetical protein